MAVQQKSSLRSRFSNMDRENRSVVELLDADFTFVNEELAKYYGLPDVTGKELRRVSLKPEDRRGGLLGMGSVLAATVHSPLLALLMVFEISLNYSLVPPLMLACAISSLVASRLHRDSIYTAPLRAKGLAEERESQQVGAATRRTVGELMREPVPPVRENTTLPEIGERFLTSAYNFLPVVDDAGRLVGVVGLHDLKDFLNAGEELAAVIAGDVMRPVPACLTPSQSLLEALPTLLASELRNVPVVNSQHEKRLVGAVPRSEALGLLSEAIAALNATKA